MTPLTPLPAVLVALPQPYGGAARAALVRLGLEGSPWADDPAVRAELETWPRLRDLHKANARLRSLSNRAADPRLAACAKLLVREPDVVAALAEALGCEAAEAARRAAVVVEPHWREAWRACDDAPALLAACAPWADHRGVVRVACACARTVREMVPIADTLPIVEFEAAARWSENPGARPPPRSAGTDWEGRSHSAAIRALESAAEAVWTRGSAAHAAAFAADALGEAVPLAQRGDGATRQAIASRLAGLVRAALPWPSLVAAVSAP